MSRTTPPPSAVESFQRILNWLAAHKKARAVLPSLRAPAAEKDLAAFEAKAKRPLPAGLAAIYLLHDGQDEEAANELLSGGGSIESGLFPSIEGEDDLPFLLVPLKELRRNIRSRMPGFRDGWLPFGDNYGGDNIVLDPGGRVLQFNHEYGGAYVLAPSLEAYLAHIADGLEGKKIVFDEDSGLHYRRALDWDDLIDKGKVEYAEEEEREEKKQKEEKKEGKKAAGKAGGGKVDPAIVGKWQVIEFHPTGQSISAISGHLNFVLEFTAAGEVVIRPPKGSPARLQKHRFICNRTPVPPQIDLVDAKFKAMRCQGVYRVEGQELLLVTGQLHEPRAGRLDWASKKTGKPWVVHRMKRVAGK